MVDRIPSLRQPILVAAFAGWNDAGEAATAAVGFLAEALGAAPFARIDPEEFYDFQVHRPAATAAPGGRRRIDWPSNEFFHARAGERDLVLLLGVEPNVRWRTYTGVVLNFARDLGVERVDMLGAFLADVAHTGPVPLLATSPAPPTASRLGLPVTSYEGPTGIVGVLAAAAAESGFSVANYWAAVPHYVPPGHDAKASLALLERVTADIGVEVDARSLRDAAETWERQVDRMVEENEALKAYVARLQEAAPEPLVQGEPPSGEALAAEVERFLRERGERPEAQ